MEGILVTTIRVMTKERIFNTPSYEKTTTGWIFRNPENKRILSLSYMFTRQGEILNGDYGQDHMWKYYDIDTRKIWEKHVEEIIDGKE